MIEKKISETARDLRSRAEEKLRKVKIDTLPPSSPEETACLIHELRVHKIEQEMQNDELRRVQEELEIVRSRYFDLYDLAPVGYLTIGENGLILEGNIVAAGLLGIPRSNIEKRPFSRFISREDQDIFYQHRKRLFESDLPQSCELRLVQGEPSSPDGSFIDSRGSGGVKKTARSEKWIYLESKIVRESEAEKPVWWAVLIDITNRKQKEAENAELIFQLGQAQKLRAIGLLAGGVAHEFNNMLIVISGYSELVMNGLEPSSPHISALKEILTASRHSADLTRQLLTFARKQIREPKVFDLNQGIRKFLGMLGSVIGENVKLRWKPADHPCFVNIDPIQLQQILINLGINARDAISGIGTFTIEIDQVILDQSFCTEYPDLVPGPCNMLTVKDDGTGIPPKNLEKIFEPFFTTKGIGEGTGLGLAVVHGIIKQNEGEILVTSEPGKGTTFRIYLPIARQEAVKTPQQDLKSEAVSGTGTILLVEDEAIILNLLTMQLKELGYAVIGTDSPNEAIRLATEHSGIIDLLLSDVLMPEVGGRDLMKRIVALRPNIRCLLMSGYSEDILQDQKGEIPFLQKPFSMASLASKIREVLSTK